jgi:hypothetical protein
MTLDEIAEDIVTQHITRCKGEYQWDGNYLGLIADIESALVDVRQAAYEDAARIAIKMQEDAPPFLALINGNDVAAKLRQRGKDVTG